MKSINFKESIPLLTFALTLVALAMAGFVAYQYRMLDRELNALEGENTELSNQLIEAKEENTYLVGQVIEKQAVIDTFQGQISSLGSTVGVLNKLAQTDKELLRKYSKVYFLNENYVPAKLDQVDANFTLKEGGTNFLIHAEVWPHLKRLLEDARREGKEVLVASAFRSFDTQASLKYGYKVTYGAGTANQFSADQGYSEHQLGTAVDFTTASLGATFSTFKSDPAYKWLLDNAHEYGFILSYPEGNAYYKFEPWHWRFVGVELATHLHNQGKHFYDLDQREIDTYLIKLFD